MQLCLYWHSSKVTIAMKSRLPAILVPSSMLYLQARDCTQWLPLRTQPALSGADAEDGGAGAADLEERMVEFDDVRECLLTLGMPALSCQMPCLRCGRWPLQAEKERCFRKRSSVCP